ncbi:MAG: hypothetical protein JW769_04105 [Parachlamydiales bacterium]|nr:hypothetical protein [Parachlamydiales bacterium]
MTKDAQKILLITSSGGGGLIQAAVAKEQELKELNPNTVIVRKDMMLEWIWRIFGWFGVNSWNWAQRHGSVFSQFGLSKFQKLAEYLFWPCVFWNALKTMLKGNFDRVIDTQPIGTSAIIKAIRIVNSLQKKNVILEKILVDLPTKKSTHFFGTIRKLSSKDKRYLKLITIEPLLEKGETPEFFWKKHCNLSSQSIQYEPFYIRSSFKHFIGKNCRKKPIDVLVRTQNAIEASVMKTIFSRGSIHAKTHDDGFVFSLPPEDKVFVILLGSQPSFQGTKDYVDNFVKVVKKHSSIKAHLFVYCSEYQAHKNNLYHYLCEHIRNMQDYPAHFSIVPMSFQKDDVVAPLFYRSDIAITRSGGQTAMELMAVSSGETWIHSETKPKDHALTLQQLLHGIPVWEAGNACYMIEKHNSKIVIPEMIPELIEPTYG